MRSKILQKISRHRVKVLIILFILGFVSYSLLESLRNYNWIANEDESFSIASLKQSINDLQPPTKPEADLGTENADGQHTTKTSLSNAHKFWKQIFTIFDENKMNLEDKFGKLIEYTDKSKHLDGPKTKEALLSRATMLDEVVSELKKRHTRVVLQLPSDIADTTYNSNQLLWLYHLSNIYFCSILITSLCLILVLFSTVPFTKNLV